MVMRFTCDNDEFFGDETGCGCIREHNNAAVTLCPADYDPVCGWFDNSIQCVTFPCAETKGNLCMASIDPNVASTTPGECPAPGSAPESKLQATECTEPRPEACTREYMPVCGQKDDGTTDTYGNQCTACADTEVLSHVPGACEADPVETTSGTCTEPRPEICTLEYMPVCGDNGQTYGNKCGACADNAVSEWTQGECSA
jgi:hypothetical protein